MRFFTPCLLAGSLLLATLRASGAPDSSPTAPAPETQAIAPAPADTLPASVAKTEAPPTTTTTPEAEAASQPPEGSTKSDAATTAAEPVAPQVFMAKIDPELALRLSLLEKTLLAQSHGQNQIYSETTRLLMFFGTACVAMGLVAMVAAVFLMNRTLASVSAITAQVAHGQNSQALAPAPSTMIAAPVGAVGFEKVQASGQRFQNRMTSLEQRLGELENLAGHASGPAAVPHAETSTDTAVDADLEPTEVTPARRTIPVAAILVRKAEALMNLGKLAEAIATLDEAAKHDGHQSEVHLARGRVLEKLGRLGDALESYDLAAATDEGNTAALLMKAGVLNRQERFDEALSCYERALAVHRATA